MLILLCVWHQFGDVCFYFTLPRCLWFLFLTWLPKNVLFTFYILWLFYFSYIIDCWGHPFRSEKNVQFNFNLVLYYSTQMSILDKALWHVFEKNMCFPDSWWNVLDCILVHVLWVWYWVIDLEVLSPIEITSLKFFAQFPLQIHQCLLHTLDSLMLGAHGAMPSHWIDPFII